LISMNKQINQNLLLEQIQKMTAEGSTNFEDAWNLAMDVLNKRRYKNPATILFFTDGLANVGKLGHELMQHLKNLTQNVDFNLTINCLGFGVDHDSVLLTNVAQQTPSGMYYYLESPNMIASCFVESVGMALSLCAFNVKVHLQAFKGCRVIAHLTPFKVDTLEKFKQFQIHAGNLSAGQSHSILLKISLNTVDASTQDLLKATLTYDTPDAKYSSDLLINISRTEDPDLPPEASTLPLRLSKPFYRLSAASWIESAVRNIQIGGQNSYSRAQQIVSDGIQELLKKAPDLVELPEGRQILFGLNEVLKGIEDPQMFQSGCHYAMAYAAVFSSGRSSGVQELMGMSKIAQTLGQNHLVSAIRDVQRKPPPSVTYYHSEEISRAKQEIARYVEGYLRPETS